MKLSDALDQIAENISDTHDRDDIKHLDEGLTHAIAALRSRPHIDAEYDVTPVIKS